jgi:hypothetical protein
MKRYVPSWKAMSLPLVLVLILSGCIGMSTEQAQSRPTVVRSVVATESPQSRTPTIPVPTATLNAAAAATPTHALAATSKPAPATTATVPVQQAAVTPKGVIYRDDFTDVKSGWPNSLEFGNYYIGYHEPDRYHVEVHVPNDRAVVAVPKRTFGDFTMETKALVEPNNTAKTGDFRYGLVFRRSGNQYYAFVVSPRTKSWHVLKSSPAGLVELKKGSNDSIQGLTADDTLRVDAKGSTFFLHINDQDVGQVSDADYAGGEVGFLVETQDSPRVHIHYGATTIREVETPQLVCTVTTDALNVRGGPSITSMVIMVIQRNARMEPLARSADGYWINVRVEGGNQVGWVSSTPGLTACNVPVGDLPMRQG